MTQRERFFDEDFQRKDAKMQSRKEQRRNELRFVATSRRLDVIIQQPLDEMGEPQLFLFSLRLCVFALKTAELA